MSFFKKEDLKKQLQEMGIKVEGNHIKKSDLKRIQASDRMDAFLDDATHAVADLWKKVSGRSMSSNTLYELNDALTAFFQGVKYDWFRDSESKEADGMVHPINPNAKSVCICPECEHENQIEDVDNEDEMYCDNCEHILDPDDCIDIKNYKWREKF